MEISQRQLEELQNRLKVGNKRGVHLNAIPARSKYKFDLHRLSIYNQNIPKDFVNVLLTKLPLNFKITPKESGSHLEIFSEDEQVQLMKIKKSFDNLINETDAIESEKGINTFGFGFPLLVRKDESDNKLTVAPILIWSLKIKRAKVASVWEIKRDEDDAIYINEVLINHLKNDSKIEIEQISEELNDGLIDKEELLDICKRIIKAININTSLNFDETFERGINDIKSISDKKSYEQQLLASNNNSFIDFCGLFSIFEVQKQNIIADYDALIANAESVEISFEDMKNHSFQSISSVKTDPSQQSILNALNKQKNTLIQGPPGTGKSQSLTAILVNALENRKKVIVVCEKRTALEVLSNALDKRGLGYLSVLIKDVKKDRKLVVDSVRASSDSLNTKALTKNGFDYSENDHKTLNIIVKNTKSLIEEINKKHQKLDEKLIGNDNWTDVVGKYLKHLKNNDKANYKIDLPKEDFSYESSEYHNLVDLTKQGENLYSRYKNFKNHSFLNRLKLIGDNPDAIKQQIEDDYSFYEKRYSEIQNEIEDYHREYIDIRKNEIADCIKIYCHLSSEFKEIYNNASEIIKKQKDEFIKCRKIKFKTELDEVTNKMDTIRSIFEKYSSNSLFLNDQKVNSLGFKIKSLFSKELSKLKKSREIVSNTIQEMETYLHQCDDLPKCEFGQTIKEHKKLFYLYIENIEIIKNQIDDQINNEWLGLHIDAFFIDEIKQQSCFNQLKHFTTKDSEIKKLLLEFDDKLQKLQSELIDKRNHIFNLINNNSDLKPIDFPNSFENIDFTLNKYLNDLNNANDTFDQIIQDEIRDLDVLKPIDENYKTPKFKIINQAYRDLVDKINRNNWTKIAIEIKEEKILRDDLTKMFQLQKDFFNSDDELFFKEFNWYKFYNNLKDSQRGIIDQLLDKEDWDKIFSVSYLNKLLIKSSNINLLPTDDKAHLELTHSLSQIEKQQIAYIHKYWRSNQINSIKNFQSNKDISIENLYNKRSSKKNKRLSLRKIVKFDIDLLTSFFPIVLTTPDIASNLFKANNSYFDIVMFDEASQLRLEDNLPALLKGKQVIIAGDEHQMPPSNYFSKIFDGTTDEDYFDDDEEKIKSDISDSLLDCESLLDFASMTHFKKNYLDFHYRSEHPYLIDFSNYAFYNQRLKPLPKKSDDIPIEYIDVNGTYVDNQNEDEAQEIISIIDNIERFEDGKYPTIGVATLNIKQRDLILEKIMDRKVADKLFNEKMTEFEENGFFVKNLENIQGDERDIIMLSTTYGINPEGKFRQSFGSLNQQKGYRLLNVIITRAKRKMYVCSSVPQKRFLEYKDHLITEVSNNGKGVFYAYLAYAKAISEEDNNARGLILTTLAENSSKNISDKPHGDLESPFEEEVYEALIEHFDENKIIPQYEFGGFRIDLVYDTKKMPKIAIECDGAKYHSSQEAYLYDRYRQKILEDNGFIFHRIWSTNWWRNPKKETQNLVNFIKDNDN